MKKLLCAVISVMMLFGAAALGEALPVEETLFNPGTYEAENQGFGGAVKVTVKVLFHVLFDLLRLIRKIRERPEPVPFAAAVIVYADQPEMLRELIDDITELELPAGRRPRENHQCLSVC